MLTAALFCFAGAGLGASAAVGATTDVDATGVRVPWMIETLPDGTTAIRWGAIQGNLAAPAGQVLDSGVPAGIPFASFATLGVSCSLFVGRTSKVTSGLQSSLVTNCTSGFGSITMQGYFQYRSLLIWRRHSGTGTFGPYTSSSASVTVGVGCTGSGSHPYRLRGRGYATAIGWGPWYNGPSSGSLSCGP